MPNLSVRGETWTEVLKKKDFIMGSSGEQFLFEAFYSTAELSLSKGDNALVSCCLIFNFP